MRAVKTHELREVDIALMGETDKLWVYNGLDCCVTAEILDVLLPQLDAVTRKTYEFSLALQAPVLEMKLRGVLIDQRRRVQVLEGCERALAALAGQLKEIVCEGIGVPDFLWSSPKQLHELLYETLGVPLVRGDTKYATGREPLERLGKYFEAGQYRHAQLVVNHVLRLRDITKKAAVLRTAIDPDGRMRTSYNIAGTTTGRFSSSVGDFGTGTNLQNIEESLRCVFVADPGMKLAYIDLEQAESRLVGAIEWNLFGDGRYLDACESGDLHTAVCRLAWTGLPWTGDLAGDRAIAERPYYRRHSYRDLAKRLGHGTNYNGKPVTMAKATHLPTATIRQFQSVYFGAFPAHQRWHQHVAATLARDGHLTTLTGRRRWFFGRRNDDATIREAIAYDPQGSVGDILNRGMLQVWRLDRCQLLLQIHDAVLVQYPEHRESDILPALLQAIQVPIALRNGRTLLIPAEAKTGWNWSLASEDNPDGLRKYTGASDPRTRPAPV